MVDRFLETSVDFSLNLGFSPVEFQQRIHIRAQAFNLLYPASPLLRLSGMSQLPCSDPPTPPYSCCYDAQGFATAHPNRPLHPGRPYHRHRRYEQFL